MTEVKFAIHENRWLFMILLRDDVTQSYQNLLINFLDWIEKFSRKKIGKDCFAPEGIYITFNSSRFSFATCFMPGLLMYTIVLNFCIVENVWHLIPC